MTRIAVAGGTGVVGRFVVEKVREAGADPVVIARSTGTDLTTGAGLGEALTGVDAVIDVTNIGTTNAAKARQFFETVTRNLLEAEQRAGVEHHVALSIVGCDRVDYGYYLGKRRQEELVAQGDVPWTVLRATQFHEFPGQLLDRFRGPMAIAPRMRSQPVAAEEVADELVHHALEGPAHFAPELAGPEVHDMPDLVRRVLRARRSRRIPITVPLPGKAGRAMARGELLPKSDGPRGRITFDRWLAKSR